jgi:hypothetical protein
MNLLAFNDNNIVFQNLPCTLFACLRQEKDAKEGYFSPFGKRDFLS